MQLSRRSFLVAQSAVLGAALAPHSLLAAAQANTASLPSLDDWTQVRRQFRMSPDYLHFSYFFLASHPEPVRAAIEGYRRAIDDNPYLVVEHALFASEAENLHRRVCADAAPYLEVRPEEIAIVGNTTTGLALVYQGLTLRPGDEVLVTEHDHFVHHEAVRLATARSGAVIRKFSMYQNAATASADEIVARVRAAIKPRTRVLGITWVHSSSGVRAPVRAIADALAEIGCSGRAAPASSGRARRNGRACVRWSPRSPSSARTWPG